MATYVLRRIFSDTKKKSKLSPKKDKLVKKGKELAGKIKPAVKELGDDISDTFLEDVLGINRNSNNYVYYVD